MLNLRRIEAFLAVAEAGSISHAAQQLDLAQSVVSRHVAALEQALGTRLFERTGRGVVPTDAAQALAPRLRAALEDMQRATQAAAEWGPEPGGTVRVGLVPAATRPLVGLLYQRVAERLPRVRLQVVDGFSNALEERLVQGELDLAVINRFGGTALRGEERLAVVPTQVIGPPGAFAPPPAEIAFRQLADLPLVLPSRPNALRTALDQLARQAGIVLKVMVEADSTLTIRDLVRQCGLYSLLPRQMFDDELSAATMSAARLVRPELPRTLALVSGALQADSAAVRAVAHEIRSLVPTPPVRALWC
ncbi:LysR family transcriptional regulator [Piscinibacter sakaiensis]|uniref:Transcriptional regulator n=1 Tax=Piscinibacter sakaiensis TaxID=1547922 RepID=A0A0K8P4L7_PISS1|nr:LysR family transcriptional regulator [Piscinibacter sakaiensis]GAP37602.1 transcriptional regulator [Piscinibacter sakaiensis]